MKMEFALVGLGIWIIALSLVYKAIEFDKKSNKANRDEEFCALRKKATIFAGSGVIGFFLGAAIILLSTI